MDIVAANCGRLRLQPTVTPKVSASAALHSKRGEPSLGEPVEMAITLD